MDTSVSPMDEMDVVDQNSDSAKQSPKKEVPFIRPKSGIQSVPFRGPLYVPGGKAIDLRTVQAPIKHKRALLHPTTQELRRRMGEYLLFNVPRAGDDRPNVPSKSSLPDASASKNKNEETNGAGHQNQMKKQTQRLPVKLKKAYASDEVPVRKSSKSAAKDPKLEP